MQWIYLCKNSLSVTSNVNIWTKLAPSVITLNSNYKRSIVKLILSTSSLSQAVCLANLRARDNCINIISKGLTKTALEFKLDVTKLCVR